VDGSFVWGGDALSATITLQMATIAEIKLFNDDLYACAE
jgi:hypothetical protein